MESKDAIIRAVSTAGGQSELARKLKALGRKISQQSISAWIRAGRLPDGKDWGIWIARAVDFDVTPHQLDPVTYENAWDGLPAELARVFIGEEKIAA
jgi:DNA-binding transcriptional regulator YdaS (Cro superfamily)